MTYLRSGILRFFSAAAIIVIADYLVLLSDCIVAGRVLGEGALGAMNLLMPVFSAVTFVSWMVASGFSSAYSLALRKDDRPRAAALAGQGVLVSVLTGVALFALAHLLEGPYLAFMAPSDAVTDLSGAFWNWYGATVLLQPLYMMLMCFAFERRGELPCIISYVVFVAVNAAVSYVLAEGLGIAGLAVGTVIAGLCATLVLVCWIFSLQTRIRFHFRLDVPGLVRALRFSFADSLVWLFHAVLFLAITKYVIYTEGSGSLPVCAVIFCIIRLSAFFVGVGVVFRSLRTAGRGPSLPPETLRVFGIGTSASFAVMALATMVFFIAPELVIGLFGIETSELVYDSKFAARLTAGCLALGGLVAGIPLLRRVKDGKIPEASLNYLQTYVLSRLAEDGGGQMFNLAKLFRLRKGIDLERLSAALSASGRSHAAFWTVLRRSADGEAVQRQELSSDIVACPIVKASEAEILANRSELVKSFDVFGGRLFDAKIFDCGERAYLLSNFHHLICDGYSFPLILEDAHRVWNGETLTPDAYYEVLARREERSRQPVAVAGRNYVRELLKERSFTTLPPDDFRGEPGCGTLELPIALPETFEDFLSSHRATRHHVFLAAAALALRRLTGDDDLLIDWVFHGRVSKEELKTVGAFMVDLPLVFDGTADMTASDVIALVKRSTFNGIKSVNVFHDVSDCNPTGQDRLTFIYQDEWGELMTPGPVRADGPYAWMIEETLPLAAPHAATENPFNVEIMEHRDATRLFLEYDTGRYAESTVRRYAEHFRESLDWLLSA